MQSVGSIPLGRVLTISQVTSHVTPLSVPIVMGLFSYFLAVQWLRSSISGGPDRPTPMQLGLLMLMCDGAGISALFASIKYIVKKSQNGQRKVAIPYILRQSVIVLGSLLAVTYVAAAADSWLHASSESIIIPSTKPYQSAVEANFGRDINATTCHISNQPVNGSLDPKLARSCGMVSSTAQGSTAELGEGIRLVDNSSTVHQMVLTDDQTVIVVPLSIPSNITYTAKTLGVRSQCETITKECLAPTLYADGSLNYGGDPALSLNCTKGGIKYDDLSSPGGVCALDSQGMCAGWENLPASNPYTTGDISTSLSYMDPTTVNVNQSDYFINNTLVYGWFIHGESGAWNVIFCNVSMLDIIYTYKSSRYITQSTSLIPFNITRAIGSPMYMTNLSTTGTISQGIDGGGSTDDPSYELVYSYELSRQLLGRATYIYAPTRVLTIQTEDNVNGSKLQLIPFIIFIASLCVFASQVMYISIRVIIGTWGVRYVELAALHLRDPLITVNGLYGHPNPLLTWDGSGDKKFGDNETEGDRLRVGPHRVSNDPAHGSIFMVTKG